jgi:hypothetical protein
MTVTAYSPISQHCEEARMMRRALVGAILAISVVFGASLVGAQTTPTTFFACVRNANGMIRMVDAGATCLAGETKISWNNIGPPGADGADGLSAYQIWLQQGNEGTEQDFLDSLVGEQGPPGPSAPAFTTRTVSPAQLPLMTPQSFAHLTVPAGNYVINASAWFGYESGTHDAPVFCRFYVEGSDEAQIVFSMHPNTATPGSLTLATDHLLRTGGRIDLSCFVNSIVEDTVVMINEVQLNAMQVGVLTSQ